MVATVIMWTKLCRIVSSKTCELLKVTAKDIEHAFYLYGQRAKALSMKLVFVYQEVQDKEVVLYVNVNKIYLNKLSKGIINYIICQ